MRKVIINASCIVEGCCAKAKHRQPLCAPHYLEMPADIRNNVYSIWRSHEAGELTNHTYRHLVQDQLASLNKQVRS